MLEKLLKNRPSIKEMLDFIPMEKDWSYSEKRMGKILILMSSHFFFYIYNFNIIFYYIF